MPEDIFADIPYKHTHAALKKGDLDLLKTLLCGFVVSVATRTYE
jgi:hypothetical protein